MPQKVLVVEDDGNIAQLLKMYLEKEGFQVQTAADGSPVDCWKETAQTAAWTDQ